MVHQGTASTASESSCREYAFGNLHLHPDGILTRGDEVIHLPPKELAALKLLLARAGQIVTHQQLKQALWGNVHVTDDSVPKCMSSLRELLAPQDCIQTVYKRGYRLATEVHRHEAELPDVLPRLAVMPFRADQNVAVHLGPAIAEEVISLLTSDPLTPARVVARDSVFSLAAQGLTAHQVGERLQADLVLTGTLRLLPAGVRLRVEMVRVNDGTQIWVEDMLVPDERTPGLESELAHRLSVRLSSGGLYPSGDDSKWQPENSPARREAYDLYLLGHHEWQSLQRHRMQDGAQHLARAIELDPTLYAAQVDLANASVAQAFSGFISPAEEAAQVRRCAEAIPTSVEGAEAILPALGWVRFHVDHDLPGAMRAFATCAHLLHETTITRLRSVMALSRHHFDEAIDIISDALRSDPYSPWLHSRLAWAYHLSGDREKSVTDAIYALELFPEHDGTNVYGAIVLAYNGETQRAVAVSDSMVRRTPYFDVGLAVNAYALARAGRRDEARLLLERLQWLSRERFVLSSFTAAVCLALGDAEGAISELQAAAEARCPWFLQMLADPRLEELQTHPEFIKMTRILERMENAAEKRSNHDRPTPILKG